MDQIETRILPASDTGVSQAVRILRAGGLVAFPTETVYGLGADATNDRAVAGIFSAKSRPVFNPLIIHVADMPTARRFALFNHAAEKLAQAFWPGPLSMVLPLNPSAGLSGLVTAGLETVAVRIPQNRLAKDLLARFGGAVAAPSANPSGRISPTSVAHVLKGLSGKIDAVLDGGDCTVGLESTIISPDKVPVLLRPGGLPAKVIEDYLGTKLAMLPSDAGLNAPGQMASHYAPQAMVRLNSRARIDGWLWLGFGPDCQGADLNLSPSGDLTEAAINLFSHLHQLDAINTPIAIAPIPMQGLGLAINDRLKRAATVR